MWPRSIALLLLAAAPACATYMPQDILKPQASFDMHCPEEQLVFVPLSGDCGKKIASDYECTLGVRGCGHQMTYSHIPGSSTWVANTSTEPVRR